jgi:hypothetical protein
VAAEATEEKCAQRVLTPTLALGSGRIRKRATPPAAPDRDECNVAIGIVRNSAALAIEFVAKRS